MCSDQQTKRKALIILLPIIGVMLVIGVFFTILINPNIVMAVSFLMPGPGAPEIKYGEFPFRLEYELNGKRYIVEDAVICEYNGYGINTAEGKFRKWKIRLASGKERITLLRISETEEVYFPTGGAKEYMGEKKKEYEIKENADKQNFKAIWYKKGSNGFSYILEAEELLKKFHIKIISWEPSPPITNSFK